MSCHRRRREASIISSSASCDISKADRPKRVRRHKTRPGVIVGCPFLDLWILSDAFFKLSLGAKSRKCDYLTLFLPRENQIYESRVYAVGAFFRQSASAANDSLAASRRVNVWAKSQCLGQESFSLGADCVLLDSNVTEKRFISVCGEKTVAEVNFLSRGKFYRFSKPKRCISR